MNKERKIINKKLESIDHKLPVEDLWNDLESRLPEYKKKRRPFFWLWSGVGIVLMFLGALWTYETITADFVSSKVESNEIKEEHMLIAESVEKGLPIKENSREAITENKEILNDKNTTVKELNSREVVDQNNPANEQFVATNNNRESSFLLEEKNLSVEATNSSFESYSKQEKEVSDFQGRVSNVFEAKNNNKALSSRYMINPKETVKDSENNATANHLIFAVLPSLSFDLASQDLDKAPALNPSFASVPSIIEPVRSVSLWEVSLHGGYGINLDNPTSYSMLDGRGEAFSSFTNVDVWSIGTDVRYAMTKSLGVRAGFSFQRLTDKYIIERGAQNAIGAFADGDGYRLSTVKERYTLYDEYDALSLQLSLDYDIAVSKSWSLRPSIGVGYNLYQNYGSDNSILADQAGVLSAVTKREIEQEEIPFIDDNRLSLHLGVDLAYQYSNKISIFGGLAARYSGGLVQREEYKRNLEAVGLTAGIRYKF